MSEANDATLSLKVMINKQKTKVLFAEADSDFTDILLSFLTLPLGKIAKLLNDHYGDASPAVGSLSNLYRSLANLDVIRFVNEAAMLMLLNPRSSFEDICPNLKLDVSDTQPTQYFTCTGSNCGSQTKAKNICVYYGSGSCDKCGGSLLNENSVMDTKGGDCGGFTRNTASFVISDDLCVVPYNTGFLQTFRNFGIGDANGAELRNVTFGIDEIFGESVGFCDRRSFPLKSEVKKSSNQYTTIATSKTMSKANDATLSLKVMINKQKSKVLFAEADSDFTDILLSFLMLPLGKIAKLLDDHYGDVSPAVGSLSNLYRSLANLDGICFVNEAAKQMLLNPRSSFEDICPNLKLDVSDTQPTQYFTCRGSGCWNEIKAKNICVYYGSGSCDKCGGSLLNENSVMDTKGSDCGGFTRNTASFVISDDLCVVPYNSGFLQTFRNFGIADTNGAELRNVTFGIDEIIGLLRRCLLSETPLTDLILNKTQKPSSAAKQSDPKISLKTDKIEDDNSENIILKITVQKSTNKLLFAQGEADFVELLFSFLTIPLGGVESLLNNNTCLKNVDNLYRSLSDSIDHKYFTTPTAKNRLMNPKLPPGYSCRKQILPLIEESIPTLYVFSGKLYYNNIHGQGSLVPFFKSPKGPDSYVKELTTYLVTDDLTVTPFGMTTGLSILDRLNIPLCDVDELDVHIGLEEALGILRASLTSTSALSTGLINHMPKKLPKLEHKLMGQIL